MKNNRTTLRCTWISYCSLIQVKRTPKTLWAAFYDDQTTQDPKKSALLTIYVDGVLLKRELFLIICAEQYRIKNLTWRHCCQCCDKKYKDKYSNDKNWLNEEIFVSLNLFTKKTVRRESLHLLARTDLVFREGNGVKTARNTHSKNFHFKLYCNVQNLYVAVTIDKNNILMQICHSFHFTGNFSIFQFLWGFFPGS